MARRRSNDTPAEITEGLSEVRFTRYLPHQDLSLSDDHGLVVSVKVEVAARDGFCERRSMRL